MPMVVTPKKDTEGIQMCVELFCLNKYARRERYHERLSPVSTSLSRVLTLVVCGCTLLARVVPIGCE